LAKGRIDALAATTKVVWEARQALGEKAVLLEAPGLYRNYTLLLAQRHFLGQRPETAVRFLRALSQAEEFIAKNPEAAGATASTVQKIPPEAYQEVADSFQHRLGLDHAMLMGLEETNRWIMRRPGAGPARPVPNFIGRLAPDPLGTVRPEAVHLQK
jgi:NitT/TauT family transport system substrate-binding protein